MAKLAARAAALRARARKRGDMLKEAVSGAGVAVVGIFAIVGLIGSVIFWGTPVWVPIQVGLFGVAFKLMGWDSRGLLLGCGSVFALDMSVFLWGLPLWVVILLSHLAVIIVVGYAFKPAVPAAVNGGPDGS